MRRWWTGPPTYASRSTPAGKSASRRRGSVDLDATTARRQSGSDVAGVADPAVGNGDTGPDPGAAQQLAAGADVGAVADHAVADQRPRTDAHTEGDDRPLDHAAGLDLHAVEDHRPIEPDAGADLGAAPDDRAADQHRARRHRCAVVYQLLAPVAVQGR